MKPYNRSVFRNLTMISQLGISVLTPILLCTYIGYKLDRCFHTDWIIIVMIILGVISGCKIAYNLAMHIIKQNEKDESRAHDDIAKKAKKKLTSKPKIRSRVYKEDDDRD